MSVQHSCIMWSHVVIIFISIKKSEEIFNDILTFLIISNAISQLGKCHNNDKSKQTSESIFENLYSKNFPTVTKSLPFFFPQYSREILWSRNSLKTMVKEWAKKNPVFLGLITMCDIDSLLYNDWYNGMNPLWIV